MKIAVKILSLYLLLLIAASCSDSLGIEEKVRTIPDEMQIKPLKIGNSWTYRVTQYDTLDNPVNSFETEYRIINSIKIGNEDWYVEDQGQMSPPVINDITNRSDGLWAYRGNPGTGTAYKIASYPADRNMDFVSSEIQSGSNTLFIMRSPVSVNVISTMPAGKFRCIKYIDKLTGSDGTVITPILNVLYYSPGVGLVMSERFKNTGARSYVFEKYELIRYQLNP